MHCPKCGHKQNSEQIRYCAKCGLDLKDFKNLLRFGSEDLKEQRRKNQRKASKQGFIMIFLGLSLVMILGALREFFPIPKIVIMLPLLVFMIGGVLRMMLPAFSDKPSILTDENVDSFASDSETRRLSGENGFDKILPEAQYQPPIDFNVSDYDTNELVSIPSVTEDTTKNLKKEVQKK